VNEDREKIIEKALKLRELANRGVGGEKQNAIRMLAAHREKHSITDSEMNLFTSIESTYYDTMNEEERGSSFNKWFRKSVTVDDRTNKPIVFYHKSRTVTMFYEFNNELGRRLYDDGSSYGFHFVDEDDRGKIHHIGNNHLGYGVEFLVYLRMINPYYIYAQLDGLSYGQEGEQYRPVTIPKSLVESLIEKGFDSIIIQSQGGANVYVVFTSNQIKSVNNNGDYNFDNPNVFG
jgi:hypothetical protein